MKVIFFKIAALLMCCISFCRADLVEDVARYSLQQDHPFHDVLNRIFASSKTLDSKTDFINAGFTIIDFRIPDFVIASHPDLPGHLVKVHLHSSGRLIEHRWRNLIKRCEAAERLRDLIQKEKLRYFTVPDKWIYITLTEDQDPVLIVTHMNIVSKKQTKYAWKNIAQRKHIKELYCITSHGCGSSKLTENVPYTQEGVFTCIDTEKAPKGDQYIKKYLSEEMRKYWDYLVKNDKKH